MTRASNDRATCCGAKIMPNMGFVRACMVQSLKQVPLYGKNPTNKGLNAQQIANLRQEVQSQQLRLVQAVEAAARAEQAGAVTTGQIRQVFQSMTDPLHIAGLDLSGTPLQIINRYLPAYGGITYGLFVDSTGNVYALSSHENPSNPYPEYNGITFRDGLLERFVKAWHTRTGLGTSHLCPSA